MLNYYIGHIVYNYSNQIIGEKMFNTPLDKFLRKMMLLGIPLFFIWFYLFVPTYPIASKVNSKEDIANFIKDVFKYEANSLQFEYQDKGGIPVEALQSVQRTIDKLEMCNFDKTCMIEAYKDHMDDWTSTKLRVITRADYMTRKFGIVGDLINKSISWIY